MVDLNATQAAIRAGYSAKTADRQASRLLRNVEVAAEIARRQAKMAQKLEISSERVLAELTRLAFANIEDVTSLDGRHRRVDLSRTTREQLAAVSEITVQEIAGGPSNGAPRVLRTKIKLYDKVQALERLGRHLGLFEKDNKQRGTTLEELVLMAIRPTETTEAAESEAPAVH